MEVCCGPVFQRGGDIQNKSIDQTRYLQLDLTTSSCCAVTNSKLSSKKFHWMSSENTVSTKIIIAGIGQRTT